MGKKGDERGSIRRPRQTQRRVGQRWRPRTLTQHSGQERTEEQDVKEKRQNERNNDEAYQWPRPPVNSKYAKAGILIRSLSEVSSLPLHSATVSISGNTQHHSLIHPIHSLVGFECPFSAFSFLVSSPTLLCPDLLLGAITRHLFHVFLCRSQDAHPLPPLRQTWPCPADTDSLPTAPGPDLLHQKCNQGAGWHGNGLLCESLVTVRRRILVIRSFESGVA